jgi:hypothetical protein
MQPILGAVIPRDVGENATLSNPSENGPFFLGDGFGKVTARNEEIGG